MKAFRSASSGFVFFLFSVAASGTETNTQILEKIWKAGHERSCSPEMRASFNVANFTRVRAKVRDESDRDSLGEALNPFLFSLGHSHTELFTDTHESFYLFRGFYAETHPEADPAPRLVNPGIQVGKDSLGYFAREVLDGFPAKAHGFQRGDRILKVGGEPFRGFWGRAQKGEVRVEAGRDGKKFEIKLPLPALEWSEALQSATYQSAHIVNLGVHRVGYVRLWTGVHPESATALAEIVKRFKSAGVDGILLDLRGGCGGAFWEHLDPFFANRKDYFVLTETSGDDQEFTQVPGQKTNPDAYLGPLVVLTNEGSRSGKEALAYQFKKSKRATLVGTTTAGYFSGGEMLFIDEPVNYLFYLCHVRGRLDNDEIEGIGISPDLTVPFSTSGALGDSQLEAGLKALTDKIGK